MVKLSKYDIFRKKNDFLWVDFIFLITLGNDINRIDKQNDGFELHIMYFNLKKES